MIAVKCRPSRDRVAQGPCVYVVKVDDCWCCEGSSGLLKGCAVGEHGGMLLGVYRRLSPSGDFTFYAGTLLRRRLGGTAFVASTSTVTGLSTAKTARARVEHDIEAGSSLQMGAEPDTRLPQGSAIVSPFESCAAFASTSCAPVSPALQVACGPCSVPLIVHVSSLLDLLVGEPSAGKSR